MTEYWVLKNLDNMFQRSDKVHKLDGYTDRQTDIDRQRELCQHIPHLTQSAAWQKSKHKLLLAQMAKPRDKLKIYPTTDYSLTTIGYLIGEFIGKRIIAR